MPPGSYIFPAEPWGTTPAGRLVIRRLVAVVRADRFSVWDILFAVPQRSPLLGPILPVFV